MTPLQDQFLRTGIVEISSPTIVRDCGELLLDLYWAGTQLALLPTTDVSTRKAIQSQGLLCSDATAIEGLVDISDLIAKLVFQAAAVNRPSVARLYDIAKHLQSFHKLLSNEFVQTKLREVLMTETLLMHKDSVGIRIDLPTELEQLTELHQEFHSFPFAANAAVLWIPLTRIDSHSGTLAFYPRPHSSEPIAFHGDSLIQEQLLSEGRFQEAQKSGKLLASEDTIGTASSLEAEAGQCYILSTMLPHLSVEADSVAQTARLTCQARFFDLNDSFLSWKSRRKDLWSGLKRPTEGWKLWQEFMSVRRD